VPSALIVKCRVSCTGIVLRTLADNPEVVYEGFIRLAILERILKTFLRTAGPLVLCAGGLACTANALWLEMEEATDIVAVGGERDKVCKGPVRSTISPAPPAAQGMNTVRLISVLSLTCTTALAGPTTIASAVTTHITTLRIFMGFSSKVN